MIDDQQINFDQVTENFENYNDFQPDIQAFKPTSDTETSSTVVSKLNVDAKLFTPPYDRYRKYRTLAQVEEMKEFKDKEAKIVTLSKGNELIKAEVLVKLQKAKSLVERGVEEDEAAKAKAEAEVSEPAQQKRAEKAGKKGNGVKKNAQRKRKISADKREQKDSIAGPSKEEIPHVPEPKPTVTQFNYKNVNYRKLYNEKPLMQPKMKAKKHK